MKYTSEIIEKFIKTGATQSAHTDELISEHLILNTKDLFYKSINIFNQIIIKIKDLKIPIVQVDLYVELLSDSNKITGVPNDINILINHIDSIGMPEIFIFKPEKEYWQPRIEIYFCPLPFRIEQVLENVSIIYQEYRTIQELQEDLEFMRWIKFSYINVS